MALAVLDRDRTIAKPGFNRWLIPPAALAVHLCIGQAYATSIYKASLVKNFDESLTSMCDRVVSVIFPREFDPRDRGACTQCVAAVAGQVQP